MSDLIGGLPADLPEEIRKMLEPVKFFATVDGDGNVTGFFPSDIWPVPPKGAVQITREQWRQFLDYQGVGVIHKLLDGELVAQRRPPVADLGLTMELAPSTVEIADEV